MHRFLLLLVLASCSNAPIPTTSTPDYPCGVTGVSCGQHMCCGQGDVCGAEDTSCPAGACCYVGGEGPFGSKALRRQWEER